MDPEVDLNEGDPKPTQKWVIDGVEYTDWERAQERITEKSKAADARFREIADQRKELETMREELDRLRAQPTGSGELPDPQTDAAGFVKAMMAQELQGRDRALQGMGAYIRQLESRVNEMSIRGMGVDPDEVKAWVREKYSSSPVEMNQILNSPRLLADQKKLMDMDRNKDEIDRVLEEKRSRKATLTTQSGDGAAVNGKRVPTPEQVEKMSKPEYDKFMDRMANDPDLELRFFTQTMS